MQILILDDQPGFAEVLALDLRSRGYAVKAFTSPVEALQAIGESDVLIADYYMPEMTGLEVARRAYAQGWRGSLLLMSGHLKAIGETLEHPLLRLVLDKPVSAQKLMELLPHPKEIPPQGK